MKSLNIKGSTLPLDHCPYCSVANPTLDFVNSMETKDATRQVHRVWRAYMCKSCGGLLIAASNFVDSSRAVIEIYPEPRKVDESIPEKPKVFLKQAIETLYAPSASIMVAASSVDAMLKEKGYRDGSLYSRIKKAKKEGLITAEMEAWAHEVRLDANDERHADENAGLPTKEDAEKCADFAQAFAEYLFVLPARIKRGRGLSPESAS